MLFALHSLVTVLDASDSAWLSYLCNLETSRARRTCSLGVYESAQLGDCHVALEHAKPPNTGIYGAMALGGP